MLLCFVSEDETQQTVRSVVMYAGQIFRTSVRRSNTHASASPPAGYAVVQAPVYSLDGGDEEVRICESVNL